MVMSGQISMLSFSTKLMGNRKYSIDIILTIKLWADVQADNGVHESVQKIQL